MADISKFISKDISDLDKIYGVSKADLSKIMNIDVPSAGQWVSKLGPEFWTPLSGTTWDGSKWIIGSNTRLTAYGTWISSYQPEKIRISGTGPGQYPGYLYIRGEHAVFILEAETYVPGSPGPEVTLDWSYNPDTNEIDYLNAYTFSTVTDIEFYEP